MLLQRPAGSFERNTSAYQEGSGEQSRLRPVLGAFQLWITIAALVLSPLFFGSVDRFWVTSWTIVLSIGVLVGITKAINAGQQRVLFTFIAIAVAYALVAAVQIVPHFISRLDDPIWMRAG